jgi:hypothetical protein
LIAREVEKLEAGTVPQRKATAGVTEGMPVPAGLGVMPDKNDMVRVEDMLGMDFG